MTEMTTSNTVASNSNELLCEGGMGRSTKRARWRSKSDGTGMVTVGAEEVRPSDESGGSGSVDDGGEDER